LPVTPNGDGRGLEGQILALRVDLTHAPERPAGGTLRLRLRRGEGDGPGRPSGQLRRGDGPERKVGVDRPRTGRGQGPEGREEVVPGRPPLLLLANVEDVERRVHHFPARPRVVLEVED